MKRATERKWHSWLNGVVLTTCPSMWGRQRRLWWTSGKTLLTTPHWQSTARLWRESAALNSWGCTSQRIHFLRRLKRASLPPPILTTFYRGELSWWLFPPECESPELYSPRSLWNPIQIRGVNWMVRHDSIHYRFSYPTIRYLLIRQKIIWYDSIRFDTGVYRSIYRYYHIIYLF